MNFELYKLSTDNLKMATRKFHHRLHRLDRIEKIIRVPKELSLEDSCMVRAKLSCGNEQNKVKLSSNSEEY